MYVPVNCLNTDKTQNVERPTPSDYLCCPLSGCDIKYHDVRRLKGHIQVAHSIKDIKYVTVKEKTINPMVDVAPPLATLSRPTSPTISLLPVSPRKPSRRHPYSRPPPPASTDPTSEDEVLKLRPLKPAQSERGQFV